MRWSSTLLSVAFGATVYVGSAAGCGGSGSSQFQGDDGGGSSGGSGSGGSGSSSGLIGGSSGGSGSGGSGGDGGKVACPAGLQCGVSCSGGATTSISGIVMDPAGRNPLYNIEVYVPANPLQPLPRGVPTGGDACNCGALFKSGAVVAATTGVDGAFKITNAPVGALKLVMQVGKWRKVVPLTTKACQDNPVGQVKLPGTIPAGDTDDNMPDIAVSTGAADTLECLMQRIGVPSSEYSAGAGGAGHVHVFSGGQPGGKGGGGKVGQPENPGWASKAPESDTTLWDSQAHLMPYDILLLSCEGGETYNANPPALEQYLNAGGRAFGSHFHYAWFSNNLSSGQSYKAPADWGANLATWAPGSNGAGNQANGKIVQALNGSTQPFAKGVALFQWLGLNGALGVLGAPPQELPMIPPRFNAVVGPGNKPSQPWVNDDITANTMYFSFDTPVNGGPNYCGRAVFSDLHVSGAQPIPDPSPGCTQAALTPQEKALEFMLFDLSACVIPDSVPPSTDGGIPGNFQ